MSDPKPGDKVQSATDQYFPKQGYYIPRGTEGSLTGEIMGGRYYEVHWPRYPHENLWSKGGDLLIQSPKE